MVNAEVNDRCTRGNAEANCTNDDKTENERMHEETPHNGTVLGETKQNRDMKLQTDLDISPVIPVESKNNFVVAETEKPICCVGLTTQDETVLSVSYKSCPESEEQTLEMQDTEPLLPTLFEITPQIPDLSVKPELESDVKVADMTVKIESLGSMTGVEHDFICYEANKQVPWDTNQELAVKEESTLDMSLEDATYKETSQLSIFTQAVSRGSLCTDDADIMPAGETKSSREHDMQPSGPDGKMNLQFHDHTVVNEECGDCCDVVRKNLNTEKSDKLSWKKNLSDSDRHIFPCPNCEKTFIYESNLKNHLRIHTGERPFSCSECEKTFKWKKNLNSHIRIHTGERPFSCPHCEKTFSSKTNQKRHKRVHTGEQPCSCPHCEQTFNCTGSLKKHIRIHTEERRFSWSHCEKTFSSKMCLIRHIRTHTGERPYSCPHCGKTFSRKNILERHIPIHTGERPFSCSHCGKTFNRKGNLSKHIMIHTGERPFSCPHCEKTFNLKCNLSRHIMIHTGERPFSCPHCEKTFSSKMCLIRHIRTHTGERPYSCPHCEKTFNSKTNLNTHIRIHTGNIPHCEKKDF